MGNTILLVEDEGIIALSTKMGLEKYGYSVITANTGEKAIEIAGKSPSVDLILMDIDLGKGIDGTEAARQILEKREIPLLFLSSHTEREVVKKTEKITSYGYVVKNSSLTVLDASIKMAFKLCNANHTLKTTVDKFEATLNAIPDLLFEINHDGYYCDIRTKSPELFFRPREEMIGKTISETLPPKQAKIIISAINEASITGISHGKQYKLDIPGIGERFFELSVAPVIKNNPDSHFIYLSRDITENKNAEILLSKSEQKYKQLDNLFRMIADNMEDMLWAKDLDGKFIFVNKTTSRFLSAVDTDEPIGKDDMFFVNRERSLHPDNPDWITFGELCINSDDVVTASKTTGRFDEYGNIKGKFLFLDVIKSPLLNDQNEMIGTIGAGRDITEQKIIEKELKKNKGNLVNSELMLNAIFNSNPNPAHLVNTNFEIILTNSKLLELKNLKQESVIGKKCYEVYQNSKEKCANCTVEKVFETKVPFKYENQLTLPNGNIKYFETYAYPVFDSNNQLVYAVETTKDITNQKKTEFFLRESEKKYLLLIENIEDSIVGTDENGRITIWNKASERLFGISNNEVVNEYLWDFHYKLLPLENRDTKLYQKMKLSINNLLKTGKLDSNAVTVREIQKPDESRIFIQSTFSIIQTEKGFNIISINRNITKQKQENERIQQLLAEKEILLKEVHHRVKNNMSTLDSMLKLQREEVHDPIAMAALEDTSMRIRTMIELYDKLYRSADYTNLSAEVYFSSLIEEILSSFPKGNSIHVNKEFDELFFDVKILHPLGIIVNEIITNVMKYAYKDITDPVLNISLKKYTNTVSLVVQDNGVGVPQNFDIEKQTGFGLRLIILLAAQLQGEFIIENNNGTRSTLTFPV
ncbi:MAG: hypothetical protein DRP58_09060 [Spirochaetes bacterium]|nr:MAG: hypothetical protein DRP58_09060 [Spirochaetota bacterium]